MIENRHDYLSFLSGLLSLILLLLPACGALEIDIVPPTESSPSAPIGTPTTDVLAPSPTTSPVAAPSRDAHHLGVNQVQGVTFTGQDSLWAATTGGAVHWNLATGAPVQYTTADGLPSNYVTDVAQAPDGGLWFATLGGVSHLNEARWTSYTEADGLVDDAVQAIAVTEDGTVWAGTTEGVSRFDGASWTTHFPGDRAWQIDIGPDGAVWFACDAAGLRRYTPDDDTWTTFKRDNDPFAPGVKTVSVDPEGGVWVYLGYDQVYRFNDETWEPVYDGRGWVCDAAFQPDGTPWIATCDGYHAHGEGLATLEDGAWHHVGRGESVQAVAVGPDGQIAAGTTRGLSVYRKGGWHTLRHGPLLNRITTVAVTPDGVTWFGFGGNSSQPTGGGVNRFDGHTWQVFDQSTGFPISDDVQLLTVDPDGRLWAAGGCGVAYRAEGEWVQAVGCEDLSGNVIGMAFDPAGPVWVATGFNVYRIDEQGGTTWESLLPTSIAVAPDGTVLIGQSTLGEGGVWTFDGEGWQPLADSPPCVSQMAVDGEGAVWAVGCEEGGLHRWVAGAWEEITAADGLPTGRIADLVPSPRGEVWVVTETGVGHLGPTGWVVRERTWEGDVREMAVAPDGAIWLGTSQGAWRIAPPVMATAPAPDATPSPEPTATSAPLPSPSPTGTPGPRALSFSAERIATETGEGVSLAWEAEGEQATICPLIDETAVGCRCLFDVPLTGSYVITPADIIGAYTGFELTVEAEGVRTVRYAPLAVECPDTSPDWFFDPSPGICPQNDPLSSPAAAQRFEHGMMIWIEALDEYYILLNHDENVSDSDQDWSTLTSLRIIRGPLALKPGASPDNRVAETPPPGLFEPVSGFGLVWRGEVVGGNKRSGIRAALGWAMEPEYGFDTVYQCEKSCGASWNCYLQGPEGEIFHFYWLLHVGHFWEVK